MSLTINNVRIAGISACVPKTVEENISLPIFKDKEEAQKVIASTGIERKRISDVNTTTSDMGFAAAKKLIADLKWEKDSIDCLIFVSQTRDFTVPQTACLLQDRLGLRNDIFVVDMPIGCSAFVHGLSVISSLLSHGGLKRGILINGETNTKNHSMQDRTVRPLFGDAATATAVEFCESAKPMHYLFGSDGAGYQAIWAQYGGFRYPETKESLEVVEYEEGIAYKGTDVLLNGMDVFGFAIKRPPHSLKQLIEEFHIDIDSVDWLLLHQANKFIDDKIRKSVKIQAEKCPYCLQDFGNVTGASIPLVVVSQIREAVSAKENHCLACGFGVGLAWATAEIYLDHIVCPELIEI